MLTEKKDRETPDDPSANAADSPREENGTHRQTDRGEETTRAEGHESPFTRIGPYKVIDQVGEGAAGIVFQAEQQEPSRLQVALKVIKDGADGKQIVSRFEAERQRLALLNHPNIAKVLGVGARPSGQPYFVMEWVEGVPITEYCDEHHLSIPERLELLVTVCQAVEYAHQKGFIHGDLKPSNVLVASEEGKAVPKILDFGVAQMTRRKPTGSNSYTTAPGNLVGQVEYMSPDRADAHVADVDTRGDVYSLGAILYELLTGTTPVTREHLTGVPLAAATRLIREETVPPPSKRLSDSKERLETAAEQRGAKPEALVKAVRGELDCLVMKALEKDAARRYQTVHDLARDLQRHLAHEPLEACPSSGGRRLRQLAREHPRVLAMAAILFFLSLAIAAAGVGTAVWAWREKSHAQKAEEEAKDKQKKAQEAEAESKAKLHLSEAARKATAKERDQAQRAERAARSSEEETKTVLAFFKDKLLSAGRPSGASISEDFWAKGQSKDIMLRQAVDRVEPQVADAFADHPLGEASIREMLGWAYLNVGEAAQAVKQYERAFSLREAMQGVNDPDTADCRNKLAVAYRLAGRPGEASRLFDQNPNSPSHASALAVRGSLLLSQKKPAEAELKLRESLAIRRKIQPDDWSTFDVQSMLGEALMDQKKYADAELLLRSGYAGLKKHRGDIPSSDKSHLTRALERLVRLYEAWGKKDQAHQWQKELETMKASSHTDNSR